GEPARRQELPPNQEVLSAPSDGLSAGGNRKRGRSRTREERKPLRPERRLACRRLRMGPPAEKVCLSSEVRELGVSSAVFLVGHSSFCPRYRTSRTRMRPNRQEEPS